MLIGMWEGQPERGPPPRAQRNSSKKIEICIFFSKKKLNKSPALLIGECYPVPTPTHPLFPWPAPPSRHGPRYLQHGTIEAWGGGTQGRYPPPRGVPQDNTTSTRKVANQAEMGTSFQGPYIQTLHGQQGGGAGGTGMGVWWAARPRRMGRQGLRPLPPHPHPTFGNNSPSGSPRRSGGASGGSPGLPCFSAGMGAPSLRLVGHAGNNELRVCCPPLTPPSTQRKGCSLEVEGWEPGRCRRALLGISWGSPRKGKRGLPGGGGVEVREEDLDPA